MIPAYEESRPWLVAAVALVALAGAPACSRNLVERAIDARGGPLHSYRKEVDATVEIGIPGRWSWEVVFREPDSFRWSLHTFGEDQRLIYDGERVVHQLGSATLPPSPPDDGVRSQARWFAVTSLDILERPEVRWEELPPSELPPGVARGLRARFADGPSPFELYFDPGGLLVRARGRVEVQPVGAGLLDAAFSDYRFIDGFRLPFSGVYRLDGELLMRESIRRWRPNDPTIGSELLSTQ